MLTMAAWKVLCDTSARTSGAPGAGDRAGGLEKPKTPPPNDSKWSRRKLDEASTLYIDDTEFWEKKYPGYTLNRVETKVSDGGMRHTIVILRRAECWHGRGNIKQTRRRPV